MFTPPTAGAPLDTQRIAKEILENPDLVNSPLNEEYGYARPIRVVNDPVVLRFLINSGADYNYVDGSGETPLHKAVTKEKVEALVKAGADPNQITSNDYKRTPLMTVDSPAATAALIKAGANVMARDANDQTPLHLYVRGDVAEMLIAAGADVNARDCCNATPLHYVTTAKAAEVLLKAGADVNAVDENGEAPLHHTVKYSRAAAAVDIAKSLIAAGADVNMKTKDGKTPLHFVTDADTAILLIKSALNWAKRIKMAQQPLQHLSSIQGFFSSEKQEAILDAMTHVIETSSTGRKATGEELAIVAPRTLDLNANSRSTNQVG
ncbi:MAG: ankyrin repeat domain-containing protein [Planctomycetaceae bacterium]